MCGISVLISITSPFLASLGSLSRGFSAIGILPNPCLLIVGLICLAHDLVQNPVPTFRDHALLDQPPQPPMVTLTSFWPAKNSPLLVLATTRMVCVVARRMRGEA